MEGKGDLLPCQQFFLGERSNYPKKTSGSPDKEQSTQLISESISKNLWWVCQDCHQWTLTSGMLFFSQRYLASSGWSRNENWLLPALLFLPHSRLCCSLMHLLTTWNGELARRLHCVRYYNIAEYMWFCQVKYVCSVALIISYPFYPLF